MTTLATVDDEEISPSSLEKAPGKLNLDTRSLEIQSMKILEYDEVDPLQAMFITRLALDFTLTPEKAGHIRLSDPRPFACLAIYAVEDGLVMGQAGIFRLPVISTAGREDVGSLWAVSTLPAYTGRGVASLLLDEAHARMRQAGLRFSVLGTHRDRVAYKLFLRHGYAETIVWVTASARWETAHQPTRLRAETPGTGGYDLVEQIFMDIAGDYLGFAWRHTPFSQLRQAVKLADIWVLKKNSRAVGYALAHMDKGMLAISNLVLQEQIDAAEAVAAVAAEMKADYVEVKIARPVEVASLQRAGFYVAHPTWEAFMVKPLVPDVTVGDAVRLFGIGTDQFLISWLDVP